jgi:hypothetical protein
VETKKLTHRNLTDFFIALFSVTALAILFVFTFYGNIIQNPNDHFFSGSEDGLKNYYTYAYQIKHNNSNTNLEGVNYPYGESFLYTDSHPIIVYSLKKLSYFFPGIKDSSIGLLNLFLVLSLIFTAIFLFLIFYELNVRYLLAVLASLAIMTLAPQIMRIAGHYALTYSCAIPITIYLIFRFEKVNHKKLYAILIALNNLFWLFIHAYLGMIVISFTLSYLIIKVLVEFRNKRGRNKSYLALLFSIFVPIAIFYIVLKQTDIHFGRTTNAGNLLINSANFFTIFLPTNFQPYYNFFKSIFSDTKVTWENLAYIGMATDIVLLSAVGILIFRSIKSRRLVFRPRWIVDKRLRIAFGASILLLLFAMDFPFIFGMEGVLDHQPFEILKNFRANGRFAWPFFFVSTIFAVYLVNHYSDYLIQNKKNVLAFTLIILFPVSLFYEGYFYHSKLSKRISKTPNLFDIEQIDVELKKAIEGIDPDKYQAILPMPFFHSGSNNFSRGSKKNIMILTLLTSYHTALPTFAARLTRVSIWESKNIVQLLSYPYYKKTIEEDLNDKRPFLIVKSHEKLSMYEDYYLKKSTLIYDGKDFQFYKIDKDVFFEDTAPDEMKKFNSLKSNLFKYKGFMVADTNSYFEYYNFEDNPGVNTYRGNGVFAKTNKRINIIAELNVENLDLDTTYIASAWFYNDGPNFGQDQANGLFLVQENDNGKISWGEFANPRNSQTIDGNWSLVELPFKIKNKNASYKLLFASTPKADKTIYIDDLLIYKAGNEIYKLEEEGDNIYLFKNNHKIKLKD